MDSPNIEPGPINGTQLPGLKRNIKPGTIGSEYLIELGSMLNIKPILHRSLVWIGTDTVFIAVLAK